MDILRRRRIKERRYRSRSFSRSRSPSQSHEKPRSHSPEKQQPQSHEECPQSHKEGPRSHEEHPQSHEERPQSYEERLQSLEKHSSQSHEKRHSVSRDRRRSHSRERHRSPVERERNKDRQRERERDRDRERGRDRERFREREWEREHGYYEDRERQRKFSHARAVNNTNSNDPALLKSRVFIGNLPTDNMDRDDLETIFEKHGRILAISLHHGYGFVQFDKVEDALKSVEALNGQQIKTYRMDVKMAAEGRRDNNRFKEMRAAKKRPADSPGRRESASPGSREVFYERYEPREPSRNLPRDADPYLSYARPSRLPARPLPPPLPPPPPKDNIMRPPFECEIILTTAVIRPYADIIERHLAAAAMLVKQKVIASDVELPRAIEDLKWLKVPYAIVLGEQNETHQSLTLNILHGTPQEHRNMPLEDAIELIRRDFEHYIQELRLKAAAPLPAPQPPPPPPPPGPLPRRELPEFLPPDEHTSYLLHLLADDRLLTLEEIDRVMQYLERRRRPLLEKRRALQGLKAVTPEPVVKTPPPSAPPSSSVYDGVGSVEVHAQPAPAAPMPKPIPPPVSSTASINFDSPSVQKALESLIQSSSALLQGHAALNTDVSPSDSASHAPVFSSGSPF